MDVPPYQFQHTRAILSSKKAAEPLGSWTLHRSITDTMSRNLDRLNDSGNRGNHWIDEIIVTMVSFCELIPKGRLDYEDSTLELRMAFIHKCSFFSLVLSQKLCLVTHHSVRMRNDYRRGRAGLDLGEFKLPLPIQMYKWYRTSLVDDVPNHLPEPFPHL
jgi:hypothetical protein